MWVKNHFKMKKFSNFLGQEQEEKSIQVHNNPAIVKTIMRVF